MQQILHNPLELPDDLPVPVDDGAADHLTGLALPDVTIRACTLFRNSAFCSP